jgi:DNA-binding NtrC family response regulator
VRLRVPSLRERPDDVLFLARHFLEAFAQQYSKNLRGFDRAAEELLETYEWPGNVRELQNAILQAVVLAEGDVVRSEDLQLSEGPSTSLGTGASTSGIARPKKDKDRPLDSARDRPLDAARDRPLDVARGKPAEVAPSASVHSRTPANAEQARHFDLAWQAFADRLADELASAISSGAKLGPPLGKWLARDVVLEAFEQAGGVATKAASCIGVPETTFSRRLRQAETEAASTRTPDSWASVRTALGDLLRSSERPSGNLVSQVDDLLFQLVMTQVPDSFPQAAGLMGVSVPTLKRRVAGFRKGGAPTDGPLVCA